VPLQRSRNGLRFPAGFDRGAGRDVPDKAGTPLPRLAEVSIGLDERLLRHVGILASDPRAGIAGRQAASRYLKALAGAGVLREHVLGKEKLFVHPTLMTLLTRDSNAFEPYQLGSNRQVSTRRQRAR
jgi:hypothetical protein